MPPELQDANWIQPCIDIEIAVAAPAQVDRAQQAARIPVVQPTAKSGGDRAGKHCQRTDRSDIKRIGRQVIAARLSFAVFEHEPCRCAAHALAGRRGIGEIECPAVGPAQPARAEPDPVERGARPHHRTGAGIEIAGRAEMACCRSILRRTSSTALPTTRPRFEITCRDWLDAIVGLPWKQGGKVDALAAGVKRPDLSASMLATDGGRAIGAGLELPESAWCCRD
jgi:hypothetical protein